MMSASERSRASASVRSQLRRNKMMEKESTERREMDLLGGERRKKKEKEKEMTVRLDQMRINWTPLSSAFGATVEP